MSSISTLELFGLIKRQLNLIFMHELKNHGLGPKQVVILRHLHREPRSSHADLARATGSDPAAVGRAVGSLMKKGWVRREEDPKDKRRWVLKLTPAGLSKMKLLMKIHEEISRRFLEPLTKEERARLHGLFEKILRELQVNGQRSGH